MERLQRRVIRDAEAADACQRLRKGPDDEVDVLEHALRFGAAEAASTVRAEGVCFVDDEKGARFAARRDDFVKRRHVAADRIQPFDDDETAAAVRLNRELAAKIRGRVVTECEDARAAQACAVVDARVALDIEHHHVVWTAQARDDPEVRLVAGREHHRLPLPIEARELAFEIAMDRERAVRRARAGGARSVPLDGRSGRRDDVGMEAQAKIVVRAAHQRTASLDDHFARAARLVDDCIEGHRAVAKCAQPLVDVGQLVE